MDDRSKKMREKRAADKIGNKMDKDNMPHSKAMQKSKAKKKNLSNMLMEGIQKKASGGGIKAGYKYGGQVKKGYNYGGCVMAGRGGSYKGES